MKHFHSALIASLLIFCTIVSAGDSTASPVKVPVTRDTWLSNVGKEADGSNGGAPRLKLKSIQEMSLIDIDPTPLMGRIIRSATLHVHLSGPEVLHRVTVGSFGAEWVEGDATGYAIKDGVSTFNHRLHPSTPWAWPGSDLTAVMLGQGGTIWRMAEASPPDAGRWQTIAVDPAIVAARVAGISTGFLLFDDTGSEWTREGDKFNFRQFPNRTIDSKDSNRSSAPYLDVHLEEADTEPPGAPTDLKSEISDLPAGEARVSWTTPADAGNAGVIGFFVDVDGKPVPRYLIPIAGKTGQRVTMHLRDLKLTAAAEATISVKAVDGAGNLSAPAPLRVKVSGETLAPLPGKNAEPFKNAGPLPKLGDAEIAIIDALDKVQPVTGQMIPPQEPGYLAANHLWDGKTIHLYGARNEIVSFQILVRGHVENMTASLDVRPKPVTKEGAIERLEFFQFRHVASKAGPVPDPVVLYHREDAGLSVPDPQENITGQTSGSMLCEFIIPEIAAGDRMGALTLSAGGKQLSIPFILTIWDFHLPNTLSFLPEMNCYGLPENEGDYYRVAHRNRTVLNRVPYHHNGSVSPGCAPIWDPKTRKLDWTEWDQRFGKYFDGSAFRREPRERVPLEVIYLPLFENWPTTMEGNYNGDYWADHAFPEQYKKDFIEVSRQFAEHFNEKGWDDTLFQCFFNGKNNFKAGGWSRATSPWLLDEPANFQDYWALKFFGELFHQGINLAPPGKARLVFRADISRPEWQRDSLDHVLDYNVVGGGAFRQYNRIVLDRKHQFGQIVIPYGGSNDPADSNVQPAAWCLDSWTLGGDGVLPWQTIGDDNSWKKADPLCLFYPGEPARLHEPVPSIRLKSYLRGEQDVEYLTILANVENQSRYLLGRRVRAALNLTGQKHGTGFTAGEDAGIIDFGALRPQDLWALRMRVGQILNEAHPKAERKLVDFRTPRREPGAGVAGYVSEK